MKKREFKVGDTVYWGTLKGKVLVVRLGVDTDYPVEVEIGGVLQPFTADGSFYEGTPQVLFHQPYELSFIEPAIEKDTKVWYRDGDFEDWRVGYYSHHDAEDNLHHIFDYSKKSTDTDGTTLWVTVVTEDPLN